MDRPMPSHTRQGRQTGRTDHHGEMRLTRTVIPCMACVTVAFVQHFQPFRFKGRLKPFTNSVFHRHFAVNPLQSFML